MIGFRQGLEFEGLGSRGLAFRVLAWCSGAAVRMSHSDYKDLE